VRDGMTSRSGIIGRNQESGVTIQGWARNQLILISDPAPMPFFDS